MIEEINEEEVYKEFEEELLKAIAIYETGKKIPQLDIFIADRVWNSLEKYTRMELKTKEKFFEELQKQTPVSEYEKGIIDLWNIDHKDMTKAIEELQKMVIQRDFKDAEMYGNKTITTRSIKLQNTWRDFKLIDKELYELHPERDFKAIEQRFVNRHIKLYKNTLKRFKDSKDLSNDLARFMKVYDKLDKTTPYFAHHDIISKTTGEIIHKKGDIIHYVDVSTYNSMLYNVNLTRSAWNRAIYDAKLLDNHLWYLPAHPFACPECAMYQGRVYADKRGLGYPLKQEAIKGGVGHPNCKHVWVSYWSPEQIQREKYNSSEWKEKYKTKQKIQSLDLQKSRLLADRRIYKDLGQQDLVDKTTAKIKTIREKKKELETLI